MIYLLLWLCVCIISDEGLSGCRVCSTVQDKDRFLLRPGEGRARTEEEEEKESKDSCSLLYHVHMIPAYCSLYSLTVVAMVGAASHR